MFLKKLLSMSSIFFILSLFGDTECYRHARSMSLDELLNADENKIEETTVRTKVERKVEGLFPNVGECGRTMLVNKIVGGKEAELTDFPWLVKLEHQKGFRKPLRSACAGSIINQRYVLTAAHCIRGQIEIDLGKLVSFRAGVYDSREKGEYCKEDLCIPPPVRYRVINIIVHDDYGEHLENDIALVKSDRNILYSISTAPVCLPDVMPPPDPLSWGLLTVAGWGRTETALFSYIKRIVDVPYVENALCKRTVAATQLCAGGKSGKDSCTGDSGGSLARILSGSWVIEGIVSYGSVCGLPKPAVYTRVRSYIDWIYDHVGG